jgi:4a-hydroxytetrahydrobiopterin dehydratase
MAEIPDRLDADGISAGLVALEGWTLREGKLHKEFVFEDFVTAFAFMSGAALCAERANHHPEWSNVYKRVSVDLWTHEAGGITEYDFALAAEMDRLAAR